MKFVPEVVNSYFKVFAPRRGMPAEQSTFPFDVTDKESVREAWEAAEAERDRHNATVTYHGASRAAPATISVWDRPRFFGPWKGARLIGEEPEFAFNAWFDNSSGPRAEPS